MLLSVLSWNPLERAASSAAKETATATLVVYAGLRTLNAFLSAAQEVEVGASVGVSGSVQPLKSLEPIDDTVERVAGIVLAISIFAGVAGLGFGPLAVVGCLAMLAGIAIWAHARPLARRLIGAGVVMAIVLPSAFLVSGLLGDAMTRSVWEENREIQDRITREIDESGVVSDEEVSQSDSLLDRLTSGFEGANAAQRFVTAAGVLRDEADDLLASYVQILAVWILKLMVLPLALMLLALRLIRVV